MSAHVVPKAKPYPDEEEEENTMSTAVLETEDRQTKPESILYAGPATPAQIEAWENFEQLPMPKRTDETWRFG